MKRDVKAILSGGKRVRATLVESAYIGQIAIMTVNMAILSKKDTLAESSYLSKSS